ncbi:hypothetical protein [Secundilactobacillus odoratitofui]|uniref:hypothetical protein n=1 Tax=Secundilactobacillus odoratitofui TaxID=480930 RepID=UPI0006D23151|nr:hypothetical protein [Secundilactobacillus odoratitofui]
MMNGKQYSKYVETGGDGSIVETIGKNETVQTLDLNNYSRLLAQTNTEKIFSPFWYSGKWIKSDYRLRYILVVNIKDVHRKLAVSKNMYQQAKLGDYINVFKTKFKIIQEK